MTMAVVIRSRRRSALAAQSRSAWPMPAKAQSPTRSLPIMPQAVTAAE